MFTEMDFASTSCSDIEQNLKHPHLLHHLLHEHGRCKAQPPRWSRVLALADHYPLRKYGDGTGVFYRYHGSDLQQASANRDGHGVSPVIRTKLRDQILDVKVDCCLGDRKAVGDLLVAVPVANQLKHLHLTVS